MDIAHSHVILDACCVLNLSASGRLAEILEAVPVEVAVSEVVRERELLKLHLLGSEEGEGLDYFEEVVERGLLVVVDFESEEETETFVNFVAILGDDGESATCAIAVHRGWAIATDDKRAISFSKQEAPHLQLVSTLDLVKHWAEVSKVTPESLRDVLEGIKVHGSYVPQRSHPLRTWWDLSIQ